VACGRRFGKSTLGEDLVIRPALEGYPVAWFSPTYKMLAEVWRDLRRILLDVTARSDQTQRRIELITGGVVELWSLDSPDVARGRKYKRVVIDEAAMIRELEEAWQAVIRPTLTDFIGDGWFLSTPKGRNFFWQAFQNGQDPLRDEWMSWQMPTIANPFIRPSEVEAARRDVPERTFAQEYLAEFLEDAGGVFRRVREACTAEPQERAIDGHQYVMGVDWARSFDFTVLSVVDITTKHQVAVDRFNQIDYRVQLDRLKALYERFQPSQIIAEQNSIGSPLIEQLAREGLPMQPFVTTNATKAAAIDALALAFERGEFRILPDATQTAELQAYESERLPSGLLRYSAPDGMHDDTVIALALAWQGALDSGPLLLWGGDEYDD
jgi:hypothetical protein